MSDINPNRMIPLHVADQAVAACEKEIATLQAEVERLKVNSGLDQKTIRNLQQTPEWSEIARLTADYRALEAENARLQGLAMIREGRLAVPYDYEQLREENARLQAELTDRKAEADRLKAEVEQIRKTVDEHLTPIPEHTTIREVERLCTAWSLMSNSLDAQWKRIKQLKAEVERLRKAGDEMYMTLVDNNRHFEEVWRDKRIFAREAFQGWNHAKEGKPSV